jgi:hypothetical protein
LDSRLATLNEIHFLIPVLHRHDLKVPCHAE